MTKNPQAPIMQLHPLPNTEDRARRLAAALPATKLRSVVCSPTIVDMDYAPGHADERFLIRLTRAANATVLSACHYFIRLQLNPRVMAQRQLTPEYVQRAIASYLTRGGATEGGLVVATDCNSDLWVVHVYIPDLHAVAADRFRKHRTALNARRVSAQGLERHLLQEICARMCSNLQLSGMVGVARAAARPTNNLRVDPATGGIVREREWVVDTSGVNMAQLWALDGVDWRRITTNDLRQVHTLLGKHALGSAIFRLLKRQLVEYAVDDAYISLVAQRMVAEAGATMFSRASMKTLTTTNLLDKMSFEAVGRVMADAGGIGTRETVCGVSSCVMVGSRPPLGTGLVHIFPTPTSPHSDDDDDTDAEADEDDDTDDSEKDDNEEDAENETIPPTQKWWEAIPPADTTTTTTTTTSSSSSAFILPTTSTPISPPSKRRQVELRFEDVPSSLLATSTPPPPFYSSAWTYAPSSPCTVPDAHFFSPSSSPS